MTLETVTFETDGPVATITLNRPEKYNALNAQLRADFAEAVRMADAAPGVRVVILRAAGRGFSAGNDISGADAKRPASDLIDREYKPALMTIHDSDKVWIAQVHGQASGIGAALALVCDLMVMAEDASLYMAFAAIALVPDGGNCFHLFHAMGYRRALDAIIQGRRIGAAECLDMGMANRVVPADELDGATRDYATGVAATAPLATAAAKRLLRQMHAMDLAQAIRLEALEQNVLGQSNDCRRGVQAFFDKNKPVFQGD